MEEDENNESDEKTHEIFDTCLSVQEEEFMQPADE